VKPAVLTRDSARVERYVAPLAELGLMTVPTPVTRTEPAGPGDRALLATACRGELDWVLVASARAVAPLVEAAGGALRARVLAVGQATADALAVAGIIAEVAGGGGAAAADALVARGARRVLVPRAEGGRDEAIERLRAAGAEVLAITAYRTVARPPGDPALGIGLDLIAHRHAAVCALFAPSQVAAVATLLAARGAAIDVLGGAVVAAIGPTTAAALTERGVRVDAVAATPDPEAMARALAAVYPPR
jgi:uroporphyrinogen-III synthase